MPRPSGRLSSLATDRPRRTRVRARGGSLLNPLSLSLSSPFSARLPFSLFASTSRALSPFQGKLRAGRPAFPPLARAREQGPPRSSIAAGQFTRRRQALAPAGWLPGTGAAAAPDMARVPSLLLARLIFLLLLLLVADAARLPLSLAPGDDAAASDALLKLKAGIKDEDGALGSWSPDTSPCGGDGNGGGTTWMGVMCNKDGVHGLQLEGLGLSGKLDLRALKSLPGPGLRTLSFMDNEFAGPLPDVKELSGLRAVFLSGNKFSGVIPADAFAGMGSLKKVVLSNNEFTGPIPPSLADAPRLLELQLNDNKFQGKIPDLKQGELTQVNLANNELEGEIPASLKSMTSDMFAG